MTSHEEAFDAWYTPGTLIDIGANLTHESFAHDLDDVLKRADEHGVKHMVVTGADLTSSQQALELAKAYPQLSATAGFHPHHAKQATPEALSELAELLDDPNIVAIGECGLDYFRDLSPRNVQQAVLEAHLELAVKTQKPVFLHQRDAHKDFLPIIKEWRDRIPKLVVHCFTDTKKALHDYLDLDLYIGLTGWVCDARRGAQVLKLASDIPKNRLMLETDCPYLLPKDLTPKPQTNRNEPMHLKHIAEVISSERHEDLENLCRNSSLNVKHFFEITL